MACAKRFFFVVTAGVLMLLMGAISCFGLGWVVWFIVGEQLVSSNIDEGYFWEVIKVMYSLVVIPPILLGLFSLLPLRDQENLKEGAAAVAYQMLHVADWLAKGLLLGAGACLAIYTLTL
ncbi:hypothetical protein [Enterovibrio norvegicus]|uniref:Uncharacterized protein n=1 Tax=Enterovibrio norvegicus TaxID=188144 RepID=A0ABV4LBU3_9GAMM